MDEFLKWSRAISSSPKLDRSLILRPCALPFAFQPKAHAGTLVDSSGKERQGISQAFPDMPFGLVA